MTGARQQPTNLSGKRALLIGLGQHDGGTGVVRYLVRAGADVTVTDRRDAAALAAAMRSLDGLPVRYLLGGHEGVAYGTTISSCVTPPCRRMRRCLREARAAGIPVEMEMTLFLAACPAPVIGVTGTKGKTTTALWIGHLLRQWKPETVIAGNMGISALDALPKITPETPVVLELSSFQLEATGERGLSPHIAVFTNLSGDHLDRYPTLEAYGEAKWAIAAHQTAGDTLIVPAWQFPGAADDPGLAFIARHIREQPGGGDAVRRVAARRGLSARVVVDRGCGYARCGATVTAPIRSDAAPISSLPGAHNRINACAVAAAALAYGAPVDAVRAGLRTFRGAPHRYEDLGVIDGVRYINDTAATAPAAAIAALADDARPGHPARGRLRQRARFYGPRGCDADGEGDCPLRWARTDATRRNARRSRLCGAGHRPGAEDG